LEKCKNPALKQDFLVYLYNSINISNGLVALLLKFEGGVP
jgi:hypothetical protein